VASDRMEFPGIAARAVDLRPVPIPVDWARSGRLGRHDVLLAANGAGWKRAAGAVDAAAPNFHPDAVISTGFCGALDEKLRIADVVVGTSIVDRAGTLSTVDGPAAAASGAICSIDHVAQTAEEKRWLRQSGACAVEMEAAGIAQRAETLGLPLYCVRTVTDLAGETLANNLNLALNSNGHFDTIVIFREALRHPTVRIPELIRLRNRCVRAARALGDFFADCRF
jgi:adenosylhomocysteine nucleosidase